MKPKIAIIYEQPQSSDQQKIIAFLTKHWGSPEIVSQGKKVNAALLPRVIARDEKGKLLGLATYAIDHENRACELVSIDSVILGKGIGTQLLSAVEKEAKKVGCHKLWLVTTNDNPEAAAFYVKRGFRLTKVCLDALEKSRQLKPQIPKIGKHGLPLQDEWLFEKEL